MVLAALLSLAAAGLATPDSRADAALLARAPSRFAAVGSLRVHYKTLGQGQGPPALVFVHGWTCDMGFWRCQVPAFADKTRVVLLDLPGHGRSDKPRIAYTMDLFARSVEAVMRAAGVHEAVLVGHSMGALVAREFYRLRPDMTRGLVVADGSLRPFTTDPATFVAPYRGPDYRQNQAVLVETMFGAQAPEALRREVRAVMLAAPQHVLLSALEGATDPALFREDPIRVPLGAIMADSPYWKGYEAFFRRLAPSVDYRALGGVGHFLMIEKPEEFNTALTDFLVKHGLLEKKQALVHD